MRPLHYAKRNIRFTIAWPVIIMMVGVILLSGCAEFKISRENTRIENRSVQGMGTASNRSTTIAPASFFGEFWEEISDGVTNRTRKMTGRQTPSRTLSETGWRMDVR